MTRLPRERRVETPGRFGMVNVSDDDFGCRLGRSVPFQWYVIPNSVNNEADLIIVSDRFRSQVEFLNVLKDPQRAKPS